ncbi:AI-2E family transporter [Anaerosacchariphilus polymeriproducens]|uniref:AI-2E family transporter n=1 Tax=Anaerosacchariphilus polymeriproducens TaxID=1812858 RepID=A0A371ASF1_9FIRM|nr:AI-2E family transporter [Anaerosacchariphilus polymeriproducens]RDU22485.1 AI-2E family transporter [Anaerosacchariphilus polymeriproducens]
MELNKDNMKKLMGLIVFTILVLVGIQRMDMVLEGFSFVWRIIFPFVLGGAIAFVLNVPMHFIEMNLNKLMKKSVIGKKISRPISLILSILIVIGVISLVAFVVIPELSVTLIGLGTNIEKFIPKAEAWVEEMFRNNTQISNWLNDVELNWDKMLESAMEFFRSGAGNVLSSTMIVAKTIANAVTNICIGFVFACYILLQKEKLHVQSKKVLYALLPKRKVLSVLYISKLSYKTFASFVTGQCVEAVILGFMFFITMSLLGFPYALLVGILIAFTALIPIFGAFIGCAVGVFLILMISPVKALAFIFLFLILQQIEGNLIYPHVVGNSVGLPSIWVLVAVTIGGNLMGVVGMLIFIPISSVLYTLFREWVYKRLKNKQIKDIV